MSNKNGSGWGVNKISFWLMALTAALYLAAAIMSVLKVAALSTIIMILQNLASAITVCLVAVFAYRYVKPKKTVWKVLYFIILAVVLIGIVIPAFII